MLIAGIDGGGTHTRLELRDEENRFLRRVEFGPFNINAIGEDAFRALLREVFAEIGDMTQCARIVIGGAGISNPRMRVAVPEELERSGFTGLWKLCGDQEIALRGATDEPAVALIAGTGSICFGKNGQGETARSGGYGHLIDDGGSGYAIGRDVLSEAVRAVDGRGTGTALLEAVYDRLGKRNPDHIVGFVYAPDTDKSAIAQYSHIALALAENGDENAVSILERNAEELYALVAAVQKKLGLAACPIASLGGLIANDTVYRRIVADKLSRLGTLIYPAHDALWGAAQMAFELT